MKTNKEINWNSELNEARIKLCRTHREIAEQNRRIEDLDRRVEGLKADNNSYLLSLWNNYLMKKQVNKTI